MSRNIVKVNGAAVMLSTAVFAGSCYAEPTVYNAQGRPLGVLGDVQNPKFVTPMRDPITGKNQLYAFSYHAIKNGVFANKTITGGLDLNIEAYFEQPNCEGPSFLDATQDNIPEMTEFDGTNLWSIEPNTGRTIALWSTSKYNTATGTLECFSGTGTATWAAPPVYLGAPNWNMAPFTVR